MRCPNGCNNIIPLEEFERHSCEEEDCPSSDLPAADSSLTLPPCTPRAATLRDVPQRTVETPTTVEKQTAANIVRRMISSSCTEANNVGVILPGKRGKVI